MRKNRFKKSRRTSAGVWRRLLLDRLLQGLRLSALLALLIAVSALFMVAYASITTSAYFRAHTISIEGNHFASRQEILHQAGISSADNLLALNLHLIRKRLMAHPWIQSAQVSRQIPHTLTIRVKEHQPLAVLDIGRHYLINEQGHIFKESGPDDPARLPVITGLAYGDLSLGQSPISTAMETVMEVLAISRGTQCAVPYSEISGLHLDKDTGVTLTTGEGARLIKLGFGQFEKKNRQLKRILAYLEGKPQWRDFHVLDTNNPERIVVQTGPSVPQANGKDV